MGIWNWEGTSIRVSEVSGDITAYAVEQLAKYRALGRVTMDNKTIMNDDLSIIEYTGHPSVMAFAEVVVKSGLAPKSFDTKEKVMLALAYGKELGISPMQSLQGLNVINGRIGIGGDLARALCEAHPDCEGINDEFLAKDGNLTCFVSVKRKNRPLVQRSFSLQDAATANLLDRPGPWKQYPKRMLYYRALGFALRDAFPDVLKGIKTTEELLDYPEQTIERPQSIISVVPKPEPGGAAATPAPDAEAISAPATAKRGRKARTGVNETSETKQETSAESKADDTAAVPEKDKSNPEPGVESSVSIPNVPENVQKDSTVAPVDILQRETVRILANDIRARLEKLGSNEYAMICKLAEYKFKDAGATVTEDLKNIETLQVDSLKKIIKYWDGLAKNLKE